VKSENPTIYIVDDDDSVRKSLSRLVHSAGYRTETFSSAIKFLDRAAPKGPACLVLDIRMPGMSGLELQKKLKTKETQNIPIVFITGHGDIPTGVDAIKGGAVDFLPKPFNDEALLSAIEISIKRDRENRTSQARISEIQKRINTLTPPRKGGFWSRHHRYAQQTDSGGPGNFGKNS